MEAETTLLRVDDSPSTGAQLSLWIRSRVWLHAWILRRSPLWEDLASLGSWLEGEAGPRADEEGESWVTLVLDDPGTISTVRMGSAVVTHPSPWPRLARFLESLQLHSLQLDVRLERNQIEHVFALLHLYRRAILAYQNRPASRSALAALFGRPGLHAYCAETLIQDRVLTVAYSYCTLGFSHVVRWLEKRNRHFRDHRALFYAAPRYALGITTLVLGPACVYATLHRHGYLLLVLLAAGGLLLGVLYFVIMTVGSVEYDNEEKAYRLGKAYRQLKKYTTRVQADIERARAVQLRFLPDLQSLPGLDKLAWAASFEPADEVAGDYYDVAVLDERYSAILFSDVCGHGMAAAFITAVIKTSFKAWVDNPGTLSELIRGLNDNLMRLTPIESFAAVFLAIYDQETGKLTYANCGHQPEPWLIRTQGSPEISTLHQARNLLLGVVEEIPLQESTIQLQSKDTVVFVSDGIVENRNPNGELYGTERFERLIQANASASAACLVESIIYDTRQFSGEAPQSDDRTVLALTLS